MPPLRHANNDALFENYLLQDVIPTIEARYRVAPGRQNRAIAGLSWAAASPCASGSAISICSARSPPSPARSPPISRLALPTCSGTDGNQREAEGPMDRLRPAGFAVPQVQEFLRPADQARHETRLPRHRRRPQLHRLAEVPVGVYAAAVSLTESQIHRRGARTRLPEKKCEPKSPLRPAIGRHSGGDRY